MLINNRLPISEKRSGPGVNHYVWAGIPWLGTITAPLRDESSRAVQANPLIGCPITYNRGAKIDENYWGIRLNAHAESAA